MTAGGTVSTRTTVRMPQRQVALVDLLDRVLAGGVVVVGEVTLSIADVDLVRLSLRVLVASVRAAAHGADLDDPAGEDPAGAEGARRAR